MVIPDSSSDKSLQIVHLGFTDLRKKCEGVRGHRRSGRHCLEHKDNGSQAWKRDANTVIALLQRDLFKSTKVIVADNGTAFRSEKLPK